MNVISLFLFIVAHAVAFAGRLIIGLGYPLTAPGRVRVAHAIYDSQLFFRNTSDSLTATETSSWLTINGVNAQDLAVVIDVPKKSIGDTAQFTLQFSENGSNARDSYAIATVASVTESTTVPFNITRPFKTRYKYARLVSTVAGTSPDFGAVVARIAKGEEWNILTRGNAAPSAPG